MISKGSPDFEVSGSQHTWMYPQRANMIANPSFEKPDTGAAAAFWSGNGTVSRVSGAAPGGGAYHANASGPSPIVAESNVFPTKLGELDSEQWTVQLMAKGNGRLKVGIVYWDVDYRATSVNWGEEGEEWILNYDTWTHVACQRHCPEAHLAMLRMELEGVTFRFDKVLVERGYLRDWPYFDGDEKYGALDDFSWYGGSQRRGASYSLWYNHRRAVVGRLYARTVDPNDPTENVTDEEMEEQGLVYRWVPAGITVVPHMDVFYPHDVQNPVPPKAPGVLPYYDEAIAPDGITNPWL